MTGKTVLKQYIHGWLTAARFREPDTGAGKYYMIGYNRGRASAVRAVRGGATLVGFAVNGQTAAKIYDVVKEEM